MSKHTPEPWAVEYDNLKPYGIFRHENGDPRDLIISPDSDGVSEADAHRIVACVNALEGFSDPERQVREMLALLRRVAAHEPPLLISPTIRSVLAEIDGEITQ